MAATSSGCWWVEGVRQPSPQVKDQAPGNDDAQEKDEGQPGLHKGPKTAREEGMVRSLWARRHPADLLFTDPDGALHKGSTEIIPHPSAGSAKGLGQSDHTAEGTIRS